jgi:hypothetical protein
MTTCARPGCENPLPEQHRGRRAIYCGPGCRPSHARRSALCVEVDHPEASPDGRPAERVWTVRLRRASRSVVIAESLGWPSAHALASDLEDLRSPPPRRRPTSID